MNGESEPEGSKSETACCSIASTMKAHNPQLEAFKSGGFINHDYDMGRVYIDLPIIEAKKLIAKLKHITMNCAEE